MKSPKSASAEDYTLMSSFEELRSQLVGPEYADRLDKPLAYWALTEDRRLPYALLDRKVGDVVSTPFDELATTPGIGRKKIASLLMLLRRVLTSEATTLEKVESEPSQPEPQPNGTFGPSSVSESLWEQWQATIRRHGLEQEKLGRFALSLRTLPTVIWDTPLSKYLDLSIGQIRGLKTHGDKRVGAVMQIFATIHELLGMVGNDRRFAVHLVPRFVAPLECWIADELRREEVPDIQEIRQNLLLPLLNQIQLDGGDTVHRLAAGRLSVEGPAESVREQSKSLNVTRARIYQLLDICTHIMAVRWPEGRWQLTALSNKYAALPADDERRVLFHDIESLIFPQRQSRVAAEPPLVEAVG